MMTRSVTSFWSYSSVDTNEARHPPSALLAPSGIGIWPQPKPKAFVSTTSHISKTLGQHCEKMRPKSKIIINVPCHFVLSVGDANAKDLWGHAGRGKGPLGATSAPREATCETNSNGCTALHIAAQKSLAQLVFAMYHLGGKRRSRWHESTMHSWATCAEAHGGATDAASICQHIYIYTNIYIYI